MGGPRWSWVSLYALEGIGTLGWPQAGPCECTHRYPTYGWPLVSPNLLQPPQGPPLHQHPWVSLNIPCPYNIPKCTQTYQHPWVPLEPPTTPFSSPTHHHPRVPGGHPWVLSPSPPNSSCFNGGTCVDGVASYTCRCRPGFTGTHCQHPADGCRGQPCLRGGTCVTTGDTYRCLCPPGYTGTQCQVSVGGGTRGCWGGGGSTRYPAPTFRSSMGVGRTGTRQFGYPKTMVSTLPQKMGVPAPTHAP